MIFPAWLPSVLGFAAVLAVAVGAGSSNPPAGSNQRPSHQHVNMRPTAGHQQLTDPHQVRRLLTLGVTAEGDITIVVTPTVGAWY